MPVLFDATILLPLLNPNVPAPTDPKTGQPITHLQQRIQALIKQLEREKTWIVIPTPALAEILVRADKAAEEYFEIINGSAYFRLVSFDERAALEVAAMTREARDAEDKRDGSDDTWAKIKFDRQIVAIAKIARVRKIYSDDNHVRALAAKLGIEVVTLAELPLPSEELQPALPLASPDTPPALPDAAPAKPETPLAGTPPDNAKGGSS